MDEAQQKLGRIHGRETARQKKKAAKKFKGVRVERAAAEKRTAKKTKKKVKLALGVKRQAGGVCGDYFPVVVDNLIDIAAPHKIVQEELCPQAGTVRSAVASQRRRGRRWRHRRDGGRDSCGVRKGCKKSIRYSGVRKKGRLG